MEIKSKEQTRRAESHSPLPNLSPSNALVPLKEQVPASAWNLVSAKLGAPQKQGVPSWGLLAAWNLQTPGPRDFCFGPVGSRVCSQRL